MPATKEGRRSTASHASGHEEREREIGCTFAMSRASCASLHMLSRSLSWVLRLAMPFSRAAMALSNPRHSWQEGSDRNTSHDVWSAYSIYTDSDVWSVYSIYTDSDVWSVYSV